MKTSILSTILSALCFSNICFAQTAPPVPPKNFETPVAASDAFIEALKKGETPALLEIFGDEYKDLIGTAEPERDRDLRGKVASMAVERRRFQFNDENSVTMVIGAEAWPFPVPIVKAESGWHFDTADGIEEVVNRRVGENELTTLEAARAYVDAQRAYAARPRDGTPVRQFARQFVSSAGKNDGLYWVADEAKGEEPSPAGPEIKDPESTYAGYHYKILTAQGEAAPAGKYDYVINGHFIGGFALIAWPADHGKTGVMTFVVNHYGDVYQRDLGPDTAKVAAAATEFNPDGEWELCEE
ncbi:MAG: DUF2950 domain-containing protein [Verrucomicrobiota bacterium]